MIEQVIVASLAALLGSLVPLARKLAPLLLERIRIVFRRGKGVNIIIERKGRDGGKRKVVQVHIHDVISFREFVDVVKDAAEEGKSASDGGSHEQP